MTKRTEKGPQPAVWVAEESKRHGMHPAYFSEQAREKYGGEGVWIGFYSFQQMRTMRVEGSAAESPEPRAHDMEPGCLACPTCGKTIRGGAVAALPAPEPLTDELVHRLRAIAKRHADNGGQLGPLLLEAAAAIATQPAPQTPHEVSRRQWEKEAGFHQTESDSSRPEAVGEQLELIEETRALVPIGYRQVVTDAICNAWCGGFNECIDGLPPAPAASGNDANSRSDVKEESAGESALLREALAERLQALPEWRVSGYSALKDAILRALGELK